MWAMVVSTALGIWLMVAPHALGYGEPAANVDRIVGPLVASAACIAIWEVNRGLRWLNLPLGAALPVCAIFLGYPVAAIANSFLVGIAVITLAVIARSDAKTRFGGSWSSLWSRS